MFRRDSAAGCRGATTEGGTVRNLDLVGPTAEDLPRLVAEATAREPHRIAVTHDGVTTTYAALYREVVSLDAAMGVLLGQASLVPIALATVFPALAEDARGDLRDVLDKLVVDLMDCVVIEPLSAAG